MPGQQGLPDARVFGADELDAGPAVPAGGRLADDRKGLPVGRPLPAPRPSARDSVELAAVVLDDPEVTAPLEGDVVAVGREG